MVMLCECSLIAKYYSNKNVYQKMLKKWWYICQNSNHSIFKNMIGCHAFQPTTSTTNSYIPTFYKSFSVWVLQKWLIANLYCSQFLAKSCRRWDKISCNVLLKVNCCGINNRIPLHVLKQIMADKSHTVQLLYLFFFRGISLHDCAMAIKAESIWVT